VDRPVGKGKSTPEDCNPFSTLCNLWEWGTAYPSVMKTMGWNKKAKSLAESAVPWTAGHDEDPH